ncbi:MAG: hypothetical protein PVI43_04050 [Candidatus Bathyarchaeota archaeon]|jgi:hypothetical protein
MKTKTRKIRISTISLILMLAISAILFALPNATAQEELRVNSWPYCNAIPNPQQVNNPVLIHIGSAWPAVSMTQLWEGLMVEITDPQGNVEMLGPYTTDATGGTGDTFTPTQIGTYTLRTYFPEQVTPDYFGFFQAPPPPGSILEEAWSPIVKLEVQADPIAEFPGQPYPTKYWTRPIDAQTWSWWKIAGHWLGDQVSMDASPPAQTLYAEFNDLAPETGHVLWAKPLTLGGLAGGQMWQQGFDQGDAYEPKWTGSVIIGGILCYNQFETTGGTSLEQRVIAVDLHTGEELWNKILTTPDGDELTLSFGQVYYFNGYNQHGVFDFLWCTQGSNWHAFDTITGRWVYSMEGMPSGTRYYGPNGEIFIYTVNQNNGWMTMWNSSAVVSPPGGVGGGSFNPQGNIYDAEDVADGIMWNATIPTGLPGSVDKVRDGIILGTNFDKYTLTIEGDNGFRYWAISIEPGEEGTLLYNESWDDLPLNVAHYDVQDASAEDDVFCVSVAESRTHYGFQLSTGELLWGPTESQHYTDNWGYSSSNSWDNIYDGKYFSGNYGGQVWCRNVTTGDTIWIHNVTDLYNVVLHNNRWRFRPAFFADGKLYIENTEHNPFDPQHRGAPFVCIDIESGEEIWRIPYRGSEWSSTPIIGDSIIAMYNEYDQRIYAIGTGASKTTVTIQNDVITQGNSVMIKGRVTDVSPGTEDAGMKLRFPDGVPAVADADMSDWMLYVYNQFEAPADVEGVEVFIKVLDPNGEYYSTYVTTDSNGMFSHMWTPSVVGEYKVTALFEGTNGYFASQSTTAFGVDAAPADAGYQGPSADEIATRTVNMMPQYPDVPTVEEIAHESATRTIAMMPQYPDTACPTIPEYLTIDIVIIILVVVVLIIGLYCCFMKKQK